MQPIYLSIQQEETGAQIRKLMMKNGYTVRDIRQIIAKSRQFYYFKSITACQYRRYPRR